MAATNTRIALVTAVFGIGQIVGPAFAGYAYDLSGSLLVPSLTAAARSCSSRARSTSAKTTWPSRFSAGVVGAAPF